MLDLGKVYAFFETETGVRACVAAVRGIVIHGKTFTLRVERSGVRTSSGTLLRWRWTGSADYKSNRLSYKG